MLNDSQSSQRGKYSILYNNVQELCSGIIVLNMQQMFWRQNCSKAHSALSSPVVRFFGQTSAYKSPATSGWWMHRAAKDGKMRLALHSTLFQGVGGGTHTEDTTISNNVPCLLNSPRLAHALTQTCIGYIHTHADTHTHTKKIVNNLYSMCSALHKS